jgi:hypothetical protein
MATVSRGLPKQPHLDVPKREARELLTQWRQGDPAARERVRHRHPKFKEPLAGSISPETFKLSDAQLVIAREYGFSHWTALKQRIAADGAAHALHKAIAAGDRETVISLLRASPEMLHLPVLNGNWGPPMSHAANFGHLEIIQACAELGARDQQHAFDRALLQGQIDCARWLHAHGAKLSPGIIMGSCETLSLDGFKFLLEAGAPLTDDHGNPLAPIALVLETYCRRPAQKHEILALFAQRGFRFPQTPAMAFHRGDLAQLEEFRRRDPHLLERRFTLAEIFPPECGCPDGGRAGMHWTPIDGTTLLHLAIDYRDQKIFEWTLAHGADVNARATVDHDGFGGHTPLFNTVVCGPWPDGTMAQALLERGADKNARANLRKFLDWIEEPHWHEARNVNPAEWGHGFPEKNWINTDALRLVDGT